MKDKKQEKDELMEKVFGKGSPKRGITEQDLKTLDSVTTGFSQELDRLKERSEQISHSTDDLLKAADEAFNATMKIQQLNNERIKNATDAVYDTSNLEGLRKQIIDDFGEEVQQESILNISNDQVDLFNRFTQIEEEMNKRVMEQSSYIATLCNAFRRPFVMGQQPSGINSSILISGPKDTGRHSSIHEIIGLLKDYEIITNSSISTIDLTKYTSKEDENNFIIDLYSAISNSYVIVFDNIDQCSASYLSYMEEILLEAKLSLNKRYVLNKQQLTETSNTLAKNTVDELSFKGKCLVYITTLKTSKLLNVLGSRFVNGLSDVLSTKAFSKDNITPLFENKRAPFVTKALTNLNIQILTEDSIRDYVRNHYDGANAGYINAFFEKLYNGLSQYKLESPTNDLQTIILSVNENDEICFNDHKLNEYIPETINNLLEEVQKELDDLVGLTEIKNYIYSLQDFYAAQQLKQAQGLETTEISKHMIFTGNPGTGKTTIARVLAKYLKAIGVLSNGQLIEVSRNDLVGKYVGHTAPLTMQVINSAIGGVLFIDEAYSLYRGENDSFGLECIDTLVKAMEDNREDLIVILAGYTREMADFMEANSGLQSRFPNQIEFPDYTGEELYDIAVINAKSAGYKIDGEAREKLIDYFAKVQENDSVRSGNGRLSRNLVEKAIRNQSTRVLKDNGALDILLLEDFDLDD